jgi:hypothetical protein
MPGKTAVAHLVAKATLAATWNAATPLTPVGYYPKSGLLPAVVEVRNQTGGWDAPGQTRQLMLSDGGWVIEHTDVEGGTRIHWSYSFFPNRGTGPLLGLIVKLLWAPYMKRVLPGIVAEVERRG